MKARRQTLKLGVKRASELAGISRTAWYDLEAGRHPPGTDTQLGVSNALWVGRDWYDRLVAGHEPTILADEPPAELDELAVRLERVERLQEAFASRLSDMAETLDDLAVMSHTHAGRRRGEETSSAL